MCDAAYLCQVEALERATLAQVALLPHLEDAARKDIKTVEQARDEFDEWLASEPEQWLMTPEDAETAALYRLLGVGGG